MQQKHQLLYSLEPSGGEKARKMIWHEKPTLEAVFLCSPPPKSNKQEHIVFVLSLSLCSPARLFTNCNFYPFKIYCASWVCTFLAPSTFRHINVDHLMTFGYSSYPDDPCGGYGVSHKQTVSLFIVTVLLPQQKAR